MSPVIDKVERQREQRKLSQREFRNSPRGKALSMVSKWRVRKDKSRIIVWLNHGQDLRNYSEFFYWLAYHLGRTEVKK